MLPQSQPRRPQPTMAVGPAGRPCRSALPVGPTPAASAVAGHAFQPCPARAIAAHDEGRPPRSWAPFGTE